MPKKPALKNNKITKKLHIREQHKKPDVNHLPLDIKELDYEYEQLEKE